MRAPDHSLADNCLFKSGHTYQQHVLSCRVALEVLKVYDEEQLVQRSHKRGLLLERLLRKKLDRISNVGDIRGRGLFYSLEFVKDKQLKERFPDRINTAALVWEECMNRGVAVFTTSIGGVSEQASRHRNELGQADNTSLPFQIMLAPPYTISKEEVAFMVDVVAEGVEAGMERAWRLTEAGMR